MSSENALVPETLLTDSELEAYNKWVSKREAPIAIGTSLKFFEVFLHGGSCEEIAKLNPGIGLGAVVACRIRDRWDERLDVHRAELLERTRSQVMQIQLEAIQFTAAQLAAAHKRDGDKIRRFLMTGDPDDLKDASYVTGIKSYKDLVSTMLALTGQDKSKDQRGPLAVSVNVGDKGGQGTTVEAIFLEKPPTEDQAAEIIRLLKEHQSE